MFFNLYRSELLRIKPSLIYSFFAVSVLSVLLDILLIAVIRQIYHHDSYGNDYYPILGLCAFALLVVCLLTPTIYIRHYTRLQEYFISYPISNLYKFSLILGVIFSVVIAMLLIPVITFGITMFWEAGFNLSVYKEVWPILGDIIKNCRFLFAFSVGYIYLLLLLINIVIMQNKRFLLIIAMPIFLLIVSPMLSQMMSINNYSYAPLGYYFLGLNLSLACAMFYRVSTLQLNSQEYLLKYIYILAGGFLLTTIVFRTIYPISFL